jgi:hypothetical protein
LGLLKKKKIISINQNEEVLDALVLIEKYSGFLKLTKSFRNTSK